MLYISMNSPNTTHNKKKQKKKPLNTIHSYKYLEQPAGKSIPSSTSKHELEELFMNKELKI
jgi:hypothetical protein